MAKKKKVLEENIVKIKKGLEEGKLILGTKEVLSALRNSKVKEVFVSSNCPESVKDDIKRLTENMIVLKQANDELGVICKKPFSISVLAIK